jgi:hypothetical protein
MVTRAELAPLVDAANFACNSLAYLLIGQAWDAIEVISVDDLLNWANYERFLEVHDFVWTEEDDPPV